MDSQRNNYKKIFKKYKILILGNGYLSRSIKKFCKDETKIFIHKKNTYMKKNYNKYLEKFIIKNGINLIINCVGQTYKNLDLYEYVYPNIILPLKILRWIEGKKILFIHFSSTDEILINSYFISKLRPPKNLNYGLSKKIISLLLKKNKNNYIYELMLPSIYGGNFKSKNLYGNLTNKSKTYVKYPNNITNFINVSDFNNIFWLLISKYNFKKRYKFDYISNNKPKSVKNFIIDEGLYKFATFNSNQKKIIDNSIYSNNKNIKDYFK